MNKADHDHSDTSLTKNQALVMQALEDSDQPLSAYTILDQLRERGFRAPQQVYRALDKLVEFGLVHRLESMNAFLACRNPSCEPHTTAAFTICYQCNQVSEFSDEKLAARLVSFARGIDFTPTKSTIELGGICSECRDS